MKKIIEFIKSNIIVAKWTFWYFFALWAILQFVFDFNMFSQHYWWKFFHATLHGFGGFVFGLLIYTAIPIYIATTITVYRKKELIITIPFVDKIIEFVSKYLPKKEIETKAEEPTVEEKTDEPTTSEFPSDMPPELRVPYMRAKNNMSFNGAVSVYNKQTAKNNIEPEQTNDTADTFPIPTDFDISESFDTNNSDMPSIPTFTDINFDEPVNPEPTLTNNTTKYFTEKQIDFETYHEFVATEKYVIYEHNDGEFWIMDDETWFAAGKQIESPINELIDLGKRNGLIPVLYLQSQNIMDIESTTNKFEDMGVRVIKSLDELD